MATTRQRKLAQAIVQNSKLPKPLNKAQLLVSSGYAESTAISVPGKIIEQPGVRDELNALGFTEENAKAVTAQVLLDPKAENRDRLKAAEITFKVHGSFQPDDTNEKPRVVNIFNNPTFLQATQTYEQSLKALLSNGTPTPIPQEAADTENA